MTPPRADDTLDLIRELDAKVHWLALRLPCRETPRRSRASDDGDREARGPSRRHRRGSTP
jgi:hypothetical protein